MHVEQSVSFNKQTSTLNSVHTTLTDLLLLTSVKQLEATAAFICDWLNVQ